MMKQKILIIEDDIFLAEVLVNKLVASGYEVVLATNGREGFEKIKSLKPDLILLDIILPEMNGYQILEAKQADPLLKDIPVIVVSNSGQPIEIKRAVTLGVKSYLIKADINPDEAVIKVKEELERLKTGAKNISISVSEPKSPTAINGKKILWVEDDRFLKDIITVRLSNEGCNLMHAADEAEAFSILEREIPDIIMLDILLPGTDGFEILKKIKSNERIKNIPVIILSNLSQPADLKKSKDLGAIKFLVKSTVTLDEIINEIKSVLSV
ncbi:MAG: response regulator [bacterium]|nr:response regulator [bacterium]